MVWKSSSNLPPGFRFHPTDEELIIHYLRNQATSRSCPVSIIPEVDIYKFDPWDLPEKAGFGEKEWYFFSPRDRKYPNGVRPNRAAVSGYWKATGTDKAIYSGNKYVGVKKALVFYIGKPPKGAKTDWIMHEYRLSESRSTPIKQNGSMRVIFLYFCCNSSSVKQAFQVSILKSIGIEISMSQTDDVLLVFLCVLRLDDWVLCRIYKKKNSVRTIDIKSEDSPISHVVTDEESNDHQADALKLPRTISHMWEFDYLLNENLYNQSFDNQNALNNFANMPRTMEKFQLIGGVSQQYSDAMKYSQVDHQSSSTLSQPIYMNSAFGFE